MKDKAEKLAWDLKHPHITRKKQIDLILQSFKEVAEAQKNLDFKIMTDTELSPPGVEEAFWNTPLVTD